MKRIINWDSKFLYSIPIILISSHFNKKTEPSMRINVVKQFYIRDSKLYNFDQRQKRQENNRESCRNVRLIQRLLVGSWHECTKLSRIICYSGGNSLHKTCHCFAADEREFVNIIGHQEHVLERKCIWRVATAYEYIIYLCT